ncbi:hypothetical protein C8Q80DRAFT_200005 [Daedaleopsis nitida]|nr:hypothetical protein C8Q80DRAFT_200005 [Daedaleopsis nitida]
MDLRELADTAASRALLHDPKHIKSLYRRAMARNKMGCLTAAIFDIHQLLALEKTRRDSRKRLDIPGRSCTQGEGWRTGDRRTKSMTRRTVLTQGKAPHVGPTITRDAVKGNAASLAMH